MPLLEDIYIIARPVYHLFYRLIHFSRKKNRSKWQPVCHNAVAPHPHVIAEYPYRGIEYHHPYFRRNSLFRRYQSGKVPVDVLRGHTARVSRICTTTIVSVSFPLFFSINVFKRYTASDKLLLESSTSPSHLGILNRRGTISRRHQYPTSHLPHLLPSPAARESMENRW